MEGDADGKAAFRVGAGERLAFGSFYDRLWVLVDHLQQGFRRVVWLIESLLPKAYGVNAQVKPRRKLYLRQMEPLADSPQLR